MLARRPSITKTKNPTSYEAGLPESGAGNEIRTRDPDLGKVVLYQLSYSRSVDQLVPTTEPYSTHPAPFVNLISKILLPETAGSTQIFLFLFGR
jgi:hypothetical protein